MKFVNGACSDCGHAVGAGEMGVHQANHDKTRIQSDPQHLIDTCEIPKAQDFRQPLTVADIAARSGQKVELKVES